jgi:hypothetical protein
MQSLLGQHTDAKQQHDAQCENFFYGSLLLQIFVTMLQK